MVVLYNTLSICFLVHDSYIENKIINHLIGTNKKETGFDNLDGKKTSRCCTYVLYIYRSINTHAQKFLWNNESATQCAALRTLRFIYKNVFNDRPIYVQSFKMKDDYRSTMLAIFFNL